MPRLTKIRARIGGGIVAALLFVIARCASAQVLVDASRAAKILEGISPKENGSLECQISPIAPAFTFSFRYQSGYLARLSLRQFHGPGHWISVLVRITPTPGGAQPFYLLRTFDIPETSNTAFSAEVAGAFLVGTGNYQANAILFDDANRACRADWQIQVKHNDRDRMLILPDSVMPISEIAAGNSAPSIDAALDRVTIFLHAAPVNPRSFNLEASDVVMAMASLMALLEHFPSHPMRLVAFNLRQQREIYRADEFTSSDLDSLTRTLDRAQFGLVDYQLLQQQPADLLRMLIRRELDEPKRSTTVVFLGPDSPYGHAESSLARDTLAAGQRFFYLQYHMAAPWIIPKDKPRIDEDQPRPMRPCQIPSMDDCKILTARAAPDAPVVDIQPSGLDVIGTLTRRLKGKTFIIRNAADFAKAVEHIAPQ